MRKAPADAPDGAAIDSGDTPRSRHLRFLARCPSRQVTQHARDRIREINARRRLLVPVEEIVQDVNRFLRG